MGDSPLSRTTAFFAMRAKPFDHIIHAFHLKAFRQLDDWNPDRWQAQGPMATHAIKMDVHVVHRTTIRVMAKLVFQNPAPIFESVDHMMFQKQGQGAENRGLVHRFQTTFQIGKRHRFLLCRQGLQDQQTHGRRFHALALQKFLAQQACSPARPRRILWTRLPRKTKWNILQNLVLHNFLLLNKRLFIPSSLSPSIHRGPSSAPPTKPRPNRQRQPSKAKRCRTSPAP